MTHCAATMSVRCTGVATTVVRIERGASPLEPRAICDECRAALDRLGISYRVVTGWQERAVLHALPAKAIAA